MGLSRFSVKRPVTTVMLIFIVVAFGFLAITNINMDMLPNINIPVALIQTSYSGAGPEEIENLITAPLEGVLGTVQGVKTISSMSSNGSSIVILEFEDNINIDTAALDMREKVDLIKGRLPSDANDPIVMKIDVNSMTSLTIGVSSQTGDLLELKRLVDKNVVSRLERQDGVASVSVAGGRDLEIDVELKPEKLRGYGISEATITQILRTENNNVPTGSVKQGDKSMSMRVTGQFNDLEEIRNLPLTTPAGSVVYLRDVADIKEVYKERASASYINGEPSVTLTIQKQSTANTVKVSDAVSRELARLQADMPNLKFNSLIDPANYIKKSLSSVTDSAMWGALFAVVVLYVFLRNYRSTLIIGLAIPISIVATFVGMYYTKMTLNVVSLSGLALGVGMLVDNSIVVLESIYRKIEEGDNRTKAAIQGAREVAASVTVSTLTTIAVFLPITFVGGTAAQMFNQLAMSIGFSLGSSLIVALTFVPMASSVLLRPQDVSGAHKSNNIFVKILNAISKGIEKLQKGYAKALDFCLARRKTTFLITLAFVILTMASMPFVGMELIAPTDEGTISVNIEMPKGTLLDECEAKSFEVVEKINDIPEIDTITMMIGSGRGTASMLGLGSSDASSISVKLISKKERDRSSIEVAKEISNRLSDVAGAKITATSTSSAMGNMGSSSVIAIYVKGDDLDKLEEIANDLVAIFSDIPGTANVKSSLEDASPQATIKVNRAKASAYGLTSSSVANIINTAVSGTVATTYKIDGDEFDIRIRQNKENFNYINDIQKILIPTPNGVTVPLYELATITTEEMPVTINRENQQKYISVSTELDGSDSNTVTTAITQKMAGYTMPDNYTWEFSGSAQQMAETFGGLGAALIIALFLVYMIMCAQFESFIYPLIIMFSIPIAFTGGFFGLLVTRVNLSMTGFLGLIILAGLVINNAIVLIDYTNLLIRERKMSVIDALKTAGPVRLRPILMTTLTTVLALVPMLISNGDGAELMRSLSAVVIFGLMLSTLVTLLLIPTLYLVVNNIKEGIIRRYNNFKSKRQKKHNPLAN